MLRYLTLVFVAIAGCGGAGADSTPVDARRAQSPGPVAETGRVESLPDLLGPLGASLATDRLARIAAFIRRWEVDPYSQVPENTTEHSTPFLMLAWLTESPDVSVTVCAALQVMADGRGGDVGPVVTPGSVFGMAAYLIEHPGTPPASAEVQVAGIESALRWYEAALRHGLTERNELLDELLARRDDLMAWYREHDIRCGDGS